MGIRNSDRTARAVTLRGSLLRRCVHRVDLLFLWNTTAPSLLSVHRSSVFINRIFIVGERELDVQI